MVERFEKFHPNLSGKHVLFVDHNMFTPGLVRHMTELERMKVTVFHNLQPIPDLADLMEADKIDFAIVHNIALGEAEKIISAVQRGKIVVVQEKDPSIELNQQFNESLKNAKVKTFSRTEPDIEKAFVKCLDYLATCVG